MNIDNNNTIMYSFVGNDINDIHAFKSIVVNTNELFDKKKDINGVINFIISDGKKFTRNISNFIDFNENINMKISVNDNGTSNYIHFINSKLRIKEIGGDPMVISSQISKSDIDHLTNKSNSIFKFDLSETEFSKIKKMSLIELTNDVLYINIRDKKLFMGENKWELMISDIDKSDISVSFPKKYFNTLRFKDNVSVYVFENYILISDTNTDLMIVLEISI